MRREIFVPSVIALIILGGFLFEKLQPPLEVHTITILSSGGINTGDNATDFILESLNGTDIRLDAFIGKKSVILDFWSADYDDSKNELKALQTVRNFYGDRVEILGIVGDANISKVRRFVKDLGIDFPILLDPNGEVKHVYDVSVQPTAYFVDTSGVIADKKEGLLTEQELNEKVKNLIRP